MENISAIITVRTFSSRLPKKCFLTVHKHHVIDHVINIVNKLHVNKVYLAIPKDKKENFLYKYLIKKNYTVFRGSTYDVLDRLYKCATKYNLKNIVRITADNPLMDYKLINKSIKKHFDKNADITTNTFLPTFPDGLDFDIINFKSLEICWKFAKRKSDREHVTPFLEKNYKKFNLKVINILSRSKLSKYRITLDEKKDFQLIKKIYKQFFNKSYYFDHTKIVKFLKSNTKFIK